MSGYIYCDIFLQNNALCGQRKRINQTYKLKHGQISKTILTENQVGSY